jgi:hypothetical protein
MFVLTFVQIVVVTLPSGRRNPNSAIEYTNSFMDDTEFLNN